eukprot:scaffold1878_cov108-Skeletonema_dohrnii-CCMP3373.AAC.1
MGSAHPLSQGMTLSWYYNTATTVILPCHVSSSNYHRRFACDTPDPERPRRDPDRATCRKRVWRQNLLY